MTTLQSIGFSIAGGTAVLVISISFYGLAVAYRHPFIAPRAAARPPDVIYNHHPTHDSQKRGNPFFGWIPWVLSLPYDTLLKGVPGTGTREGGLSGSMLRLNLDGIVLLRFHALCQRVSTVASALLLIVVMPMYISGQCYRVSEQDATKYPGCASLQYNLTNYEKTTIANVPSLPDARSYTTLNDASGQGVIVRMYFVVFCFWLIIIYICHQLKQEWILIVAMRRVYWLEADTWGERREELKQTLLYDESSKQKKRRMQHFSFDDDNDDKAKQNYSDQFEKHLTNRDPWIPHPEQRDTVPNVGLYSVLVGGLPSLPEQAADTIDTEATIQFSKRERIDWQLSLTSTVFDHCVPNQPGFSSSVAAVTIIPGAGELSRAWRRWYSAAGKLRRLRFIRSLIAERRRYEIQVEDVEAGEEQDGSDLSLKVDLHSPNIVEETPRSIYHHPSANKEYFRQVLGSLADDSIDSHVFDALNFGPEQAAVYSREFAQAAAPCCPNGCFEGRVRRMRIDELLELEEIAAEQVHRANLALREARQKATVTYTDHSAALKKTKTAQSEPAIKTTLSVEKGHQRVKSYEGLQLPNDIELENSLYHKGISASFGSGDENAETKPAGAKKAHRPNKSIEAAKMPNDLGLESSLYHRASSEQQNNKTACHPLKAHQEETKQEMATISESVVSPVESVQHDDVDPLNVDTQYIIDEETGLKMRALESTPWNRVRAIVEESKNRDSARSFEGKRFVPDGVWEWPSVKSLLGRTKKKAKGIGKWAKVQSTAAVEGLARESAYAVVTFTSRQAAVAARHCLTDGRGTNRWVSLEDIPIPPLADAAACDLVACRNCCRPVTISLSDRQKSLRNIFSLVLLSSIYSFYTIPLTIVSSFIGNPSNLGQIFPQLARWAEANDLNVINLMSGFLSAFVWSLFFALCPILFKSIANFGSKATSVAAAEFKAMQYFWWFMVLTAFSGSLLGNMILYGFNDGLRFGSEFTSVVRAIALTIPKTISATWLNWIIFRFLVIMPLNYLLQINTFIFHLLGMNCCSRLARGGGPGGPTPFRIYVDSGTVLLCLLALAPASPLVAPACFFYFLFSQPLLRRNAIFVYRPKFDGGGLRFPFIFDMCISAVVVGQILLITQMALKQALGPTIAAAIPLIPTLAFQRGCKKQYGKSFKDAALLQTSLLDGWDTSEESSVERREEFRRFLVDAHKAAYVPVCISGTDTDDFLTAEPAVVVPLDTDIPKEEASTSLGSIPETDDRPRMPSTSSIPEIHLPTETADRRMSQHGATLRRAVHTISAMKVRSQSASGSQYFNLSSDGDANREPSPFSRSSILRSYDTSGELDPSQKAK